MVAAVFFGMRPVWRMKTMRLRGTHVAIAEEAPLCNCTYTFSGGG